MSTIRGRIIVIVILLLGSVWFLLPKNVTQRVPDRATGRMKDTSVRRVPINLGLDLQGGIHLALEVDQSKGPVPDCHDAILRAERVVRTRVDEFGTTEPVVQVVGNCRLVVELAGEKDPTRAKQIVMQTAFLEFRITDMKNQFRDALPAIDGALRQAGVKAPAGAPVSAVSQLFGQDTTKKGVAKDTTPDANAPGALSALLFQGQLPGEFLVPEEQVARAESLLARPEVQATIPRGLELRWGTASEVRNARAYRPLYAVENRAIITGEELTKASARRDQLNNHSVVVFDLSRRGTRKFCEETGRHVHDYMAIILDSRVQGQPPIINDQICGTGQIDLQSKPLTEAQDLALVLRAGALPAPLQIVEERTIGPSLGAGFDPRRDSRRRRRGRIGHPGHGGLLSPVRRAGRVGPRALRPDDAGGAVGVRLHAHPAGARRPRAVGGDRGGRQRADLRADPRGAAARQDRAPRGG